MNLPDAQATDLLAQLVRLSGETPEQALRVALAERLERLRREAEQSNNSGKLTREQTEELFGY